MRFAFTARRLISIAVTKSNSLSTRRGSDTAVSPKVRNATAPPTSTCAAISIRPSAVARNVSSEVFPTLDTPRNRATVMCAKKLQKRKIKASASPIQGSCRARSAQTTPSTSDQTSGSSASSRRLIS